MWETRTNSVGNGRHTTAKFPTQHGYVASPLVRWKAQRFPCSDQGLKWEMQVLIVEVSATRTREICPPGLRLRCG